MYAQIDDIIFEAINSFTSFGDNEEALWAKNALLIGKPTWQPTANESRQANISIRLHQEFIDIKTAYASLLVKVRDHVVCPLIWGNGDVEGDFFITSISRTFEEMDNAGNLFSVVVNLSITEYDVQDPLTIRKNAAKKEALAIQDNIPVVNSPSQTSLLRQYYNTLNQEIAKLRSFITAPINGIKNNPVTESLGLIGNTMTVLDNAKSQLGIVSLGATLNSLNNQVNSVLNNILTNGIIENLLDDLDGLVSSMSTFLVPIGIVGASTPQGKQAMAKYMGASKTNALNLQSFLKYGIVSEEFANKKLAGIRSATSSLTDLINQDLTDNRQTQIQDLINSVDDSVDLVTAALPSLDISIVSPLVDDLVNTVRELFNQSILWTYQVITRQPELVRPEDKQYDYSPYDYSPEDYLTLN